MDPSTPEPTSSLTETDSDLEDTLPSSEKLSSLVRIKQQEQYRKKCPKKENRPRTSDAHILRCLTISETLTSHALLDQQLGYILRRDIKSFGESLVKNPTTLLIEIENGRTLNHHICLLNDFTLAIELMCLSLPFAPNFSHQDVEGNTPLHLCCRKQNFVLLKLMLDHDPNLDVSARNLSGFPVTHLLAFYHPTPESQEFKTYREIVLKLFDDKKVDVTLRTNTGNSILHLAAVVGNLFMVNQILEANIYVDLRNNQSETALFLAIRSKNYECARLILCHDADPLAKTFEEKTPFQLTQDFPASDPLRQMMIEVMDASSTGIKPSWITKPKSSAIIKKEKRDGIFKENFVKHFMELISLSPPKQTFGLFSRGKTEFTDQMSIILTELIQAHYGSVNFVPTSTCWSAIFHKAVVLSNCRSIIYPNDVERIIAVVEAYCSGLAARRHTSNPARGFTDSLLHFLRVHHHDPCNILINHSPSDALLLDIGSPLLDIYQAFEPLETELTAFAGEDEEQEREIFADVTDYPLLSHSETQQLIIRWATLPNEALCKKVRALSILMQTQARMQKLWQEKSLREGDIVITVIKTTKGLRHRYLRYSGIRVGARKVRLFTTPDELTTRDVDLFLVIPLDSATCEKLHSPKTMKTLVQTPEDKLLRRILQKVQKEHLKLLSSQGVDQELMTRCITLSVEINDKPAVKKMHSSLSHILASFSDTHKDFFARVRKEIEFQDIIFHASEMETVFLLVRDFTRIGLQDVPLETIAEQRLKNYLVHCETVLSIIENKAIRVFNGSNKQEITRWWLRLINLRNQTFLEQLDFNFNALPKNYIQHPPNNIKDVISNLQIINNVLSDNKHRLQEHIKSITNEIYPVIDQFISNAKFVISDLLQIHSLKFHSKYIESLIRQTDANPSGLINPSPETAKMVQDLLKDIKYLKTIKKIELTLESGDKRTSKKDRNIVPISGLAIGYFYRLENEIRTAMEVWHQLFIDSPPISPAPGLSPRSSFSRPPTPDPTFESESSQSMRATLSPTLSPDPYRMQNESSLRSSAPPSSTFSSAVQKSTDPSLQKEDKERIKFGQNQSLTFIFPPAHNFGEVFMEQEGSSSWVSSKATGSSRQLFLRRDSPPFPSDQHL